MTHCEICLNKEGNKEHVVREMMFGTGDIFHYLECGHCGTLALLDPPQNLASYYPDSYYSYYGLVHSPAWKNVLKQIRLKLYLTLDVNPPIYGQWLKVAGAEKSHKIADIGCGNGQYLYELNACGYQHLEGYDPFIDSDHKVNKALTIYKRSIFEIEDIESFDIIMMHHAFEHMEKPREVIEKSFQLLKSGGLLLIRIPVADALVWQQYGTDWIQLDAPRHFFLHTKKSMKLMADAVGFQTENIIFDSTSLQFWGSELYKLGVSLQDGKDLSRFSKSQLQEWENEAILLNKNHKGDQACFYLRKGKS